MNIQSLLFLIWLLPFFYQTGSLPVTPPPDGHLCWDHDQALPPEETFEEFIQTVDEGQGIYTHFRPAGTDNVEFRRMDRGFMGGTFNVSANEPVDLLLELFTRESEPQHIRYLLIHNEQQVTLPVNGNSVPFFDVVLVSGEMQSFILTLSPLTPGIHDVVLVGLQDFDVMPEPTGRISTFSFRLSLIAGEENSISNGSESLGYSTFTAASEVEIHTDRVYPLTLTLSDQSLLQWSFPEPLLKVNAGEPLSFYAWVGYQDATFARDTNLDPLPYSRFALLALVNYQQVSIHPDETVIYGAIDRDNWLANIPITLQVPDTAGVYDLLVIQINNPRVPMCVLLGPPEGYFINPQVMHNRASFEIVPH